MKRISGVLVTLAFGAVLAACGDKALLQDEYVKRANAVCAASQETFQALFETDMPVLQSDTPAFFKKATPIVRDQIAKLRDLHAPSPNHGEVKRFLAQGDKTVADYAHGERDAVFGAKIFTENGGKHAEAVSNQAAT